MQAKRDAIGHEENLGIRLLRHLSVPASESQTAVVLAVSMVMMALLIYALLWQSNIISYQREVIQWLWSARFGG